jgi:hypothetical protein
MVQEHLQLITPLLVRSVIKSVLIRSRGLEKKRLMEEEKKDKDSDEV